MSGTFADESTRVRARLVVLISGGGSNLQALIDATSDADFPAQIVGVGADRADATGLDRAKRAGVPTFVVDPKQYSDRGEWDRALAAAIAPFDAEWVVSAGFMPSRSRPAMTKHRCTNASNRSSTNSLSRWSPAFVVMMFR